MHLTMCTHHLWGLPENRLFLEKSLPKVFHPRLDTELLLWTSRLFGRRKFLNIFSRPGFFEDYFSEFPTITLDILVRHLLRLYEITSLKKRKHTKLKSFLKNCLRFQGYFRKTPLKSLILQTQLQYIVLIGSFTKCVLFRSYCLPRTKTKKRNLTFPRPSLIFQKKRVFFPSFQGFSAVLNSECQQQMSKRIGISLSSLR